MINLASARRCLRRLDGRLHPEPVRGRGQFRRVGAVRAVDPPQEGARVPAATLLPETGEQCQ